MNIMRAFLMLIIFALAFSGYSAAAHAFGHGDCQSAVMGHMSGDTAQMTDMADCPDHNGAEQEQSAKDLSQTDQSNSSKSAAKCLDCIHCCVTHGVSTIDLGYVPHAQGNEHIAFADRLAVDGFLYTLLRPPKSLV